MTPSRQPTAGDRPIAAREPHGHEGVTPQASAAREPGIPAFARHLKRATAGAPSVAVSDPGRATFYHPSYAAVRVPAAPERDGPSRPEQVCGDLGKFPNGNRLLFTLPIKYAPSYGDT